jgi:hypothetical protein
MQVHVHARQAGNRHSCGGSVCGSGGGSRSEGGAGSGESGNRSPGSALANHGAQDAIARGRRRTHRVRSGVEQGGRSALPRDQLSATIGAVLKVLAKRHAIRWAVGVKPIEAARCRRGIRQTGKDLSVVHRWLLRASASMS